MAERGIIPTRPAWERVSRAVRAFEQDSREDTGRQIRRPRENAQRMHAAIITDVFGGPNATYDAQGVANLTVLVANLAPVNRAILGVNYLPVDLGSLCFIVEDLDGNRELWAPETIETQDCDEEPALSLGELNADRQAQSWMGF